MTDYTQKETEGERREINKQDGGGVQDVVLLLYEVTHSKPTLKLALKVTGIPYQKRKNKPLLF